MANTCHGRIGIDCDKHGERIFEHIACPLCQEQRIAELEAQLEDGIAGLKAKVADLHIKNAVLIGDAGLLKTQHEIDEQLLFTAKRQAEFIAGKCEAIEAAKVAAKLILEAVGDENNDI